jgi:hypothetical protein
MLRRPPPLQPAGKAEIAADLSAADMARIRAHARTLVGLRASKDMTTPPQPVAGCEHRPQAIDCSVDESSSRDATAIAPPTAAAAADGESYVHTFRVRYP